MSKEGRRNEEEERANREKEGDKKRKRGDFERFGSRCGDSPSRDRMRGDERERGVEEKNREMGLNAGKTGYHPRP